MLKKLIILPMLLLSSFATHSAVLVFDGSDVTGINDVLIDGASWDASFYSGAWDNTYDIYTTDFATSASNSLQTLINDADSGELFTWRNNYTSTLGCEGTAGGCQLLTAYGESSVSISYSLAILGGWDSVATGASRAIELDPTGSIVQWTVSPVPEPSTLALMLAGFGLIGFKSHRRNKLSA